MKNFTMKTYKDSYIYNNKISKNDASDPSRRTSEALKDYILTCTRIEDKKSDAFRGIIEEIKRQQRSTILLTVLLMDNVKICIGNSEMPRAFKVFDARDSKSGGRPSVFIDVTGLIEYQNGYYYCKQIDKLCAYLMDALVYLLYRYSPMRIVENSTITLAATDCYISCFDFILDYLRITEYGPNKNKISYFAGLFFLNNMMGKDIDNYTKGIAGKIAGLSANEIRAYDLYFEDGMFDNIYTFVTFLINTFKLKGFTFEVFISKWMRLYQVGTQYGCELFTSFMIMLCNAYSGSYIVNQKQIERCCSMQNLVKIWNAIEKAGVSTFDNRAFMKESDLKIYEVHDKNSMNLLESLKMRNDKCVAIECSDFSNTENVKGKVKDTIKYCNEARIENKLPAKAEKIIMTGIEAMYENAVGLVSGLESTYEVGSLVSVSKILKNTVSDRQRYDIETTINRDINALRDIVRESECSKEVTNQISKSVSELMQVKQYV